jgi:predicted nuclease of predicted toxin-antitoxin system
VKLLFDQNISHRVTLRLKEQSFEVFHVRDFEMQFAQDRQIWNFAKDNGYTLVTFDSDFNDLATLFGHPPKIIWLRFGNTMTSELVSKILSKMPEILSFIEDDQYSEISCLEIDN